MIEVSFRDKIVALRDEWRLNPIDEQKDPNFWIIMNSISEELAVKWGNRLLELKYQNIVIDDFLSLRDILWSYKYNKSIEQKVFYDGEYHYITKKQKLKILFKVIKFWDDLEMSYYC